MPRFNPSEHPRFPNGRFRPKFSQSVRVSPISVSYNVGVRLPIVPGRANLYVGGLARVERSGGNNFFKRTTDRVVNAAARAFGDTGGRSNLSQILKGNEIRAKGLRIQGPSRLINTPSFRVSSTPASRDAPTVRSPRRAPRTRSAARARAPRRSNGIRSTPPVVRLARPTRRRSARAIGGRRTR